jgi:hypothetical protein
MKDVIRQAAVILSTMAVLAINGLASASGLNGQTTGEISDRFQVYFVPAGYVFSIWGLIYLALIAYSIYQALPSQRKSRRLRRIGWLYVLSGAANIAWLFLWHYEYFRWTIAAMAVLLLVLIGIYLILGTGRSRVSGAETWLVRIPFSIYLGWITVATIANATSLLDYLNWSGWGVAPEWWAVIILIVATIITAVVSLTRGDVAYVLVIAWAFAGIALKHSETPIVAVTASVMAGLSLLTLLLGVPLLFRRIQVQTVQSQRLGIRDRW